MKLDVFELRDCFPALRALPDKSLDHMFTDPPFTAHVHGMRRAWETQPSGLKTMTAVDEIPFDPIDEAEMVELAEQCARVLRGWALLFCAIEQVGDWVDCLVEAGGIKHNTCLWTKSVAAPKFNGTGPAAAAEAIVCAWFGRGPGTWNAGGSLGHYHLPVDNGRHVHRRHDTQKPIQLIRQVLLDFTRPGQSVIDPFAGGGSTPIGCKQLGRPYLAYEKGGSPETLQSYHEGVAELARTRLMTEAEQRMYHRERSNDGAYGVPLKSIAMPLGFETERKGRRLSE